MLGVGVTAAIAVGAVLVIDSSGDVGRVSSDDTGTATAPEGTREPPVEVTATKDGPDRHLIGSNLSQPDPRGTEIAFRDRFKFSSV